MFDLRKNRFGKGREVRSEADTGEEPKAKCKAVKHEPAGPDRLKGTSAERRGNFVEHKSR
jgi:hypothetical protein